MSESLGKINFFPAILLLIGGNSPLMIYTEENQESYSCYNKSVY